MDKKLESRIKRLERMMSCCNLKNRRFERVNLHDAEDLLESVKQILKENGFSLYDKQKEGSWAVEFYINNETWATAYLSVDTKTENPVYTKIASPRTKSSDHVIREVNDLLRFEDDLDYVV